MSRTPLEQRMQHVERVVRAQLQGGSRVVEHAGSRGEIAQPHDHAHRLPSRVINLAANTNGEVGVIGEHSSRSDDHRIDLGADPVDVRARIGRGDPSARAVGGGDATVEGRGCLPGDERTAARDRE
ncbi:unannotated protein [freshwater metagenome]|uniref:Unannotated protein n=1 Tax=freshwater metagenome TaxID=449393 RepID=A0A6J7I9S0_9ZZZZ